MPQLIFRMSDEFANDARAAFDEHRHRIREHLRNAEVRPTGGTSIAGVLTSGDVDLQVRVTPEVFEDACKVLSRLYESFHLDARHAECAFFTSPDSEPQVEVALTVIGCLDDFHHGEAWDRIAADRELVEQYNAMKCAHEGGSLDEYLAAKRAFFYANFRL